MTVSNGRRLQRIRETDGMNDIMTSRQAFEAMRFFLSRFNEREPIERRQTINQLLRWTKVEPNGWTNDRAQWADWERAGFKLEAQSVVLRNADDHLDTLVFDPAIRGRTDRFVFRFRKVR